MSLDREAAVTAAFVTIAGTLTEGFDVVDLLTGLTVRCAELLDVAEAGLLLADEAGVLHVMAASSEASRQVELYQLQRDQGPCLDCYVTGTPTLVADLTAHRDSWPAFVAAATEAGFASVHAVPMRLRGTTLGALGLFGTQVGVLNDEDVSLAQALADCASIALVQHRVSAEGEELREQLQNALTSRIAIEQAKGILAHQGSLNMDQAFATLRRYSRDHNQPLTQVARALVSRTLAAKDVIDHATSKGAITAERR